MEMMERMISLTVEVQTLRANKSVYDETLQKPFSSKDNANINPILVTKLSTTKLPSINDSESDFDANSDG
ncbi:hypothetical protein, partial [Serratia marcescens]|uniref:hypothetical protein n=1 Tax=Serratia marcescens TaxID=615 RepID=UPI00281311BA